MFKKVTDIDKKKLLLKASDVKKDSLTRLKHFKTLIDHLEANELPSLFKSHFSFIYHTFIDTFSTFDCNSKQRRDDLTCVLFMLEKILIYNADLIKKRWQFYSLTFVMQKLLHRNNTWRLRQEGVRLFILWSQILCDETNNELQTMFASLVPNLVPETHLPGCQVTSSANQVFQSHPLDQQHLLNQGPNQGMIKLCSIEPMMPQAPNEQLPSDEVPFYLDCILQFMVTQISKPIWSTPEETSRNRELSFSYSFNMFKKIYLPHMFPGFNADILPDNSLRPKHFSASNIHSYVDSSIDDYHRTKEQISESKSISSQARAKRDLLSVDLGTSSHLALSGPSNDEHEHLMAMSIYQSTVIKWLTRIMRQDMIPGQDEFLKPSGGSVERRDFRSGTRDPSTGQINQEFIYTGDANSSSMFHNMEASTIEMDIARRVAGTWTENISVIHELFRRSFLNYFQPASMKRVVNVYKEWICSGGPVQIGGTNSKNIRLGYTSFGDLLQVFVVNSSHAFLTRAHTAAMLDEQVEMCKRIMNIYRYMVMKIYMNTSTWEQLLIVMLNITERLFSPVPPEKKESTIGGRIAPAFFQTFIVSWIRANLYVHISPQMWTDFHRVMKNLVRWRELVEEWSTTMSSLTRVLVKHVYGLSLSDLPLDKPQDRRRRPRAMKSFSTAEVVDTKSPSDKSCQSTRMGSKNARGGLDANRSQSMLTSKYSSQRGLVRSNSEGILTNKLYKLYYSSNRFSEAFESTSGNLSRLVRKIKSDCIMADLGLRSIGVRSYSPHGDVIDGASLKESNMIDNDQVIESQVVVSGNSKASNANNPSKAHDVKSGSDKCVLLGGTVRGWASDNSVIMWRRMLGLFGNINHISDTDNHLVAMRGLAAMLQDFIKTRDNQSISIDNQYTPDLPNLVPPYLYFVGWLLEATHLPRQFKESRLIAYKLLCQMTIRRHDMELSQVHYTAFYEALYRGLASPDGQVYAVIIKHCTHLLTLELPGSSLLVQSLFERARSILLNLSKEAEQLGQVGLPQLEAIQILNSMLSLSRPLRKLLVLKSESNGGNPFSLATPEDVRSKIFDTFLACCNARSSLDETTRSKSLGALVMHVYQEMSDKGDSLEVEKVFECILADLQESHASSEPNQVRNNCDLLRLFTDHATILCQSRPALVSATIQILCQLIVRLSAQESNKELLHCLLICLEEWCITAGKSFLMKSSETGPADELDMVTATATSSSPYLNESLITVVLRSLESAALGEHYLDAETSHRSTRGSTSSASRLGGPGSDTLSATTSASDFAASATGSGSNLKTSAHDESSSETSKAIALACRVSHQKLLTFLGHFPLRQVGSASLSCCVSELDYLDSEEPDEFKRAHEVNLFMINDTTLVTFIGSSLANSDLPIHIIVRSLCGKFCWDATCLSEMAAGSLASGESTGGGAFSSTSDHDQEDSVVLDPDTFQRDDMRASMKYDSDFNEDGNSSSSLSSRTSANRDCICDLLSQLSTSSNGAANCDSSSGYNYYKKRNSALSVSNPRFKIASAEETMIALLTNQRFQELNYCELQSDEPDRVELRFFSSAKSWSCSLNGGAMGRQKAIDGDPVVLSFERCRQFIQQLGFLTWEKRNKINSLAKSPRLLRELKNLDSQAGRETHKIAVIYVANGQEDKTSILANSQGSRAFEHFVSGLGWEVNLASHLGFKGGLQANKSSSETSTYFCSSTTEVMFHVSTRLPLLGPADDENLNKKLRHLGNDEVHIVWSEHWRDYRRAIIPTEFGDVLIVIYPLLTFQGYFRIQVSSKADVPPFGPLSDNCVVHQSSLAPLVRATAINASRAKRATLAYYQSHYEERERLIKTILRNHKQELSFEEFAAQLYRRSETALGPTVTGGRPKGPTSQQAASEQCCA